MDQLLELLSENARLSTEELAVMLNAAPEDVARRIADYEKKGVIRGYRALIDWDKVDQNYAQALIELKVIPKRDRGFDEIAGRLMEFPEVDSVYLMSGGYDLAVIVKGRSMQEIALFVARRLSPLESVQSTATHFFLTRYKEGGVVMNAEEEKEDERRSVFCD